MSPAGIRKLRLEVTAVVLAGLAYYLTAHVSFLLRFSKWDQCVVWLAAGTAYALVVIMGTRIWPGIFIASVLVNLSVHSENPFTRDAFAYLLPLFISLGNVLAPLAGRTVWRFLDGKGSFALDRPVDLLFFTVSTVIVAAVSAVFGVSSMYMTVSLHPADLISEFFVWFSGDFTGILIFAPLVLCFRRPYLPRFSRRGLAERLAFLALFVPAAVFIFSQETDSLLVMAIFPFLFWPVVRLGLFESALSVFIVSTLAVWYSADASGPFTADLSDAPAAVLYVFTSVVSLVTLLLATSFREGRLARKDLEGSELRHRTMLESLKEGVAVLSSSKRVLYVNQQLEEMLGYSRTELQNNPLWGFADPCCRKWILDLVSEAPEPGGKLLSCVFRHKQGRSVKLLLNAVSCKSLEEGEGLLLTFNDITRQEMMERETRLLEQKLQQARKMEALGRVTGGIAHDFNNILTSITADVNLLALKRSEDPELQTVLKQIEAAADRAARLTGAILTFSRKHVGNLKPLELNGVIQSFKKMIETSVGNGVRIEYFLHEPLPMISGDAGNLEQILLNLAVNGKNAMPKGGTLTIRTAVASYRFTDEGHPEAAEQPCVLLSVSDTGEGMDEQVKSLIFEPFFTTRESGTGLGLSIVYGIVRQHGAAVEVYSKLQQGSRFDIYFPIATPAAVECGSAAPARQPLSGGSERILLVEDEPSVLRAAKGILDYFGYAVLTATNAEEAMKVLEAEARIDLVISDVIMPGKSGLELSRDLASKYPGLKVLLTSGYPDLDGKNSEDDRAQVLFLQKPYSADRLVHSVRMLLDGEVSSETGLPGDLSKW